MLGAFAPLLGHAHLRTWHPSLIVFSPEGAWYGIPSYEVQKLFMHSAGPYSAQVGGYLTTKPWCRLSRCAVCRWVHVWGTGAGILLVSGGRQQGREVPPATGFRKHAGTLGILSILSLCRACSAGSVCVSVCVCLCVCVCGLCLETRYSTWETNCS